MKQKTNYSRIAIDSFVVQSKWALTALGIIITIYTIRLWVANISGNQLGDFFTSYYHAANIYMLVIGIITASGLMPFFISNGFTRKDFFKGGALAALGVSIAIAILFGIITGLEHTLGNVVNLPLEIDQSSGIGFAEKATDNVLASLILMIIDVPFMALSSGNWSLPLLIFCLNLITYYVLGWMIGAAFYRNNGLGIGVIMLSVVFLIIRDLLWGREPGGLLATLIPFSAIDLPLLTSVVGTITIIGLILCIIRLITSRMAIKI
ncbi:hypothetical protein V6C27_10005 [Peptococcaceae bacterium 1198_IL3148]